jgi:Ca2+-binding EF-hand superfamily protein
MESKMTKAAAWTLATGLLVALCTTAAGPAHAARASAAEDPAFAASPWHGTGTVSVLGPARLPTPRVVLADRDGDGVVTADEALAYFRARFTLMDTDGGGVLSKDEFLDGDPVLAARAVAQDPLRRDRAPDFAALDLTGNGRVSAEEFVLGRIFAAGRADLDERRRRRVALFELLDRDGDGVISRDEYMAVTARYFLSRDQNEDGQVTIWQFHAGPLF